MGFFTGASDALQELLIEQEHKQRQAMLDAIAADDRKSRDEDRRSNRAIQHENAVSQRTAREEASAAAKQGAADKFEASTAMGTELDDAGVGILSAAGRGSHVKQTPTTASARVVNGLGAPTAGNPLGLDTSTAPAVKVVEGKRIFGGTAKQQDEERRRTDRAAYIKGLPAGPTRSYLEAQDATGDSSLPTELLRDRGADADRALEDKKELLRLAASLHPPKEPRARFDVKTGQTKEGAQVIIRTNVDTGVVDVIPMQGVAHTGNEPKPAPHVDTPAEIFEKKKAAAGGTKAGQATGGIDWSGVAGKIPIVKKFVTPPAPAPGGGAGPQVGDTKKFPNGAVGTWDGTGWAK